MKKILIATAIAAALVAPQAFAQAANFAGLSLAANVNVTTATTELSGVGVTAKLGEGSQTASLQAAYGMAVGSNVVLGFGGTYALGDTKTGSLSSGGVTLGFKGKDMYSIYFEPGYAVSNSTMLYGKLAYLSMKAEVTANNLSASQNMNGVGYGVGVRTMLDKNLFVQVEFSQSDYESKTVNGGTYKPTGSTGTVGIGYKF